MVAPPPKQDLVLFRRRRVATVDLGFGCGRGGSDFGIADRHSPNHRRSVHHLEPVADQNEGCPVVGMGKVLGAFFVGFVASGSGAVGGVLEGEFAVE
jgi:hypothetical protein